MHKCYVMAISHGFAHLNSKGPETRLAPQAKSMSLVQTRISELAIK